MNDDLKKAAIEYLMNTFKGEIPVSAPVVQAAVAIVLTPITLTATQTT